MGARYAVKAWGGYSEAPWGAQGGISFSGSAFVGLAGKPLATSKKCLSDKPVGGAEDFHLPKRGDYWRMKVAAFREALAVLTRANAGLALDIRP